MLSGNNKEAAARTAPPAAEPVAKLASVVRRNVVAQPVDEPLMARLGELESRGFSFAVHADEVAGFVNPGVS
jgi:EAL and modified HD-GYP domain-containing signal transduction protein